MRMHTLNIHDHAVHFKDKVDLFKNCTKINETPKIMFNVYLMNNQDKTNVYHSVE